MLKPLMQRITAEYNGSAAFNDAKRDVDGLGSKFGEADRNVAGFAASLGRTASFLKTGAFVAGGAVALIGGTTAAVGQVADEIARVGDEAKRAGLGVEAFQELQYVANQNRISVDALTDGMKELNLRADEFISTGAGSGAEAFERLGYSAKSLARKLDDPSALLTEIVGKLENFDRAAQIRISDEIFGGTGGEQFVQLLEAGEAALARTIQEARDLGIVLDEETIAKADELDRKFSIIATTVDRQLKGAIVDAASALSDFMDGFKDIEDISNRQLKERYLNISVRRVEVDGEIQRIMGEISRAGNNTGLVMPLENHMRVYRSELEALAEEEKRILDLLNERDPVKSKSKSSSSPPTPPERPDDLGNGSNDRSAEISQFDKVMDALRHEAELIGKTQLEQDALNQIRRAGVDVMSDEADQIRQQVIANNELTLAIEAQAKAEAERQQQINEMTNVAMSHYDELIAGTESLAEAIVGTIEDIAEAWLRQQAYQGLSQLFGFVMDGFGSIGLPGLQPRANGGHVAGGSPYMVGERGPELFVPNSQGVIIPSHRMGGGGGAIELKIDVAGAKGNKEIMEMVELGVSRALAQYDAGTNERVAKALVENQIYRTE